MTKNLIFILIFLLPFTISAQNESKNIERFVNELDKKIPQALNDFSVPGTAIAIIENGEIILQKGYGFADVEKKVQVTTKTGFNIASISKTIAAWGVMKLVKEGKIDLDASAEKYLTRWHLPESEFNSEEVTIRRLLSHTAGLSLHGYPGWTPNDTLPTIEESLSGKNNGPEGVEIILKPGTKYQYSGGGYTILQLIIEEVTGQTFEDYMQEHILDPLGMTNSSYKIDNKIMTASAFEYDNFGEKIDFELFTAQAAAGLHTNIEDFTNFAFANLYRMDSLQKNTPILSADIVQLMMEPVPSKIGDYGYGLGYEIDMNETLNGLTGHNGDNTGWHAMFRIDPVTNDGFILFTNGGAGYNIINMVFCEWVTWNTGESLWDGCHIKLPIASKLKQVIDKKGLKNIEATYVSLKEQQPDEYNFSENQLNDLGYFYMARKELEKAISIFKLNSQTFPYSWNTYDSYAEALLSYGKKNEAIENYKTSIKLNPENENGKTILKNLGVSINDLVIKLPIEYLKLLEGEYISTSDQEKKIVYAIENGELVRVYKDRDRKIRLIPIGNNEFVYLDLGLHVVFDINNPKTIILTTSDKGEYKKIK